MPAENQSFCLLMYAQAPLVLFCYFFFSLWSFISVKDSISKLNAVIVVRNLSCTSRNTWLCWEAGYNDLVTSGRLGSGSTGAQLSASGSSAQLG